MVRLKWPRVPMILGLVLGPLAEKRLFISSNNYGFAWLLRPGVLALIALTVAGVLYPILRTRRQKKNGDSDAATSQSKVVRWNGIESLKFSWAAIFALFILVVVILFLWESRHFNARAGLFPWAIGFPVLALAITQFVMDFMGRGEQSGKNHPIEVEIELPVELVNRRTIEIFAWIIGFFVGIWLLGFSIATAFCTFVYLVRSGEKWPLTLVLTAAAWVFIYGLFDFFLHVPFPTGLLLQWVFS
jgi:hypothetical protein